MSESLKKMLSAKIAGHLEDWPGLTGVLNIIEADEGNPQVYPSATVKIVDLTEEIVGAGIWLGHIQVSFQWKRDELPEFTRSDAAAAWAAICDALACNLAEALTDTDHSGVWLKVWGVRARDGGATSQDEREFSTVYNLRLLCADVEAAPGE
jgi:hypothetical protein